MTYTQSSYKFLFPRLFLAIVILAIFGSVLLSAPTISSASHTTKPLAKPRAEVNKFRSPLFWAKNISAIVLFSKFVPFYVFSGSSHSISCQKVTSLEFGGAFSGPTSGTIIVDPNTAISRSSSGGVILNTQKPGHPALLNLTIYNKKHCDEDDHENDDDNECDRSEDDDHNSNDSHNNFTRHGVYNTISLPNSSSLKRIGGNQTMSADNFKINRTNGNIYIGATLHVSANQASGVYSGTFTVTEVCN